MENSRKTWLLALLLMLLPCVAGAASLGKMNVLSALGQPLVCEIELLSVSQEDLRSLSARVASREAYQAANLQYDAAFVGATASIERRPNGQHYLKLVSKRPVNEPFIDVLIEVTWSSGRLSREYTALLDPPGVAPAPAALGAAAPEASPAPVAVAAPEPVAAPAPAAPAPEAQPEPAAPAASKPISRPAAAGAKEYGPIQRGETLGKIAKELMPEGVTLEQMLVALYRSNPDAFINKNLNLVRAGKVLRVPEKEEIASISSGEATTEYRTHVTDWNSYRQKLAGTAGAVATEGRSTVSGKITAKVEEEKDRGGEPKDVLRLSKGEAPGAGQGKPRTNAERIRSLEEEVVAREKALNEANERIAQLDKTLKDLQTLAALKSPGPAAQQGAAPQSEAGKAQPAKAEVVALTGAPAGEKPVAKNSSVAAGKSQPQAKPRPKEPELMDQVLEAMTDPLYLGLGGGAIVLGGLPLWIARRRRR